MDELSFISDAQRGNVAAFNALVLAYQTRAYNLAYRLIGDPDTAADATQDAFLMAFRHLQQFRGGNFAAWLMRIVTNTCYDELRRRKRRPAISTDALTEDASEHVAFMSDPDENPENITARRALNQAIQDCLDDLPPAFRMVAVLCDVQGYDYREIADIANVSLGTVKSRLSRARQRLRECLQGIGELLPATYRLDSQVHDAEAEA